MKNSTRVKVLGRVKANAVNLTREQDRETLALLRILALGRRQVQAGKTVPADVVFRRLRKRLSRP